MARRAIVVLLLTGAAVHAEDEFGRRGQVVPFGSISFQHGGGNGVDFNSVGLFPGALWFAADNVAIGGSIGYGQSWGTQVPETHVFTVEPQLGFSIPLGDRAALFPQIGVDYVHQWQSGMTLPGGVVFVGGSSNLLTVRAFAPVLFVPVPHFFVGFGPQFSVVAAGTPSGQWLLGTTTEIGGYF
jgi:hypothetical protein